MRPFLFCGLILALIAAAFGGCSSNSSTPTVTPAAGVATEVALPKGWKPFNEGEFAGGVATGWQTMTLKSADLVKPGWTPPAGLPTAYANQFAQAAREGRFSDLFFVFIDKGQGKATNINVLTCATGQKTIAELRQAYDKAGVKSEDAGTLKYAGKDTGIAKVDLGGSFDSYQAVAQGQTCYAVVTFTAPKGDTSRLDDFKTFMSVLTIKK